MDSQEMEDNVRRLMELWEKGGKGKLSYSKAKRRIEKAMERGCPMLRDCTKCEKVRECPVLNCNEEG